MKRSISFALSVILLLTSVFCVNFTSSAATAEDEYQTYLSDYLLENTVAQDYINRKDPLPYRMYVEQRRNNPAYDALVTSWRVGTFSLSDITKYADKEVAYYETILFDILLDDESGSSVLDDIDNLTDSIYASSFKKLYSMYSEIMKPNAALMDTSSNEYKQFMKASKELKGMSKAFELIDNVDKYYSYCTDTADFVKKCSQVQSVAVNYSMLGDILTDISSRTSNLALKAACTEFRGMINSSVDNLLVQEIFIERKGAKILADDILSEIWTSVLEICTEFGFAIKAGQAMGKISAGILFNTDKDIEHVYKMYALYDFEDILTDCLISYQSTYKSSRTIQNAYKYNEAFKLFLKVQLEGATFSRDYVTILYDGGAVYQIYKYFQQDDYNTFMQYILNAENMIKNYINHINTSVYNGFMDWYLANTDATVIEVINASKITQTVTESQYNESVTYIKAISTLYYGLNIKEPTTLTGDVMSYVDCYISANVDLNGHILTIKGNLLQSGGTMEIGAGTLHVTGDYRIQSKGTNDTYSSSSGYLSMKNAAGQVEVDGSFYTQSGCDHEKYLIAGTMTVGGDFYQIGSSGSSSMYNFCATGTHKVVFKGNKTHSVSFDSSNSHFKQLEETDGAKVKFIKEFTGFALSQDIQMETSTLTAGTLNLNGHTLSVTGNLLQSGGTMEIGAGTLYVTGDYRIQSKGTNDTYTSSSGYLSMKNAAGQVEVDGSFYTQSGCDHEKYLIAGTMTVGGDFYQIGSSGSSSMYNFCATGTHKVVFKGNKTHSVSFDSSNSHFKQLEETDGSKIIILKKFSGFSLSKDVELVTDCLALTDGSIILNGHKLTVTGNLLQSGGTMEIGAGTLHVTGDYRIQSKGTNDTYSSSSGYLSMKNAAGQVEVDGSFYTQSGCDHEKYLIAGTMTVGGDFYQILAGNSYNFCASGTHKVVLSGKNVKVSFSSGNSKFNVLELSNQRKYYDFSRENCWKTLIIPECKHNYVVAESVSATCTKDGLITYVCTECDDTYSESVKANGHKYDAVVTAPTCKDQGYTIYNCSVCGDSYKANYTAPTEEHDYKSVISRQPTCIAEGVKTFTCSICGDTYNETVAKIAHTLVVDIAENATCTKNGKTEGSHCSVCGEVIVAQAAISALGHNWDSGKVTKAATPTAEGVKTYTCTVCKETRIEAVPKCAKYTNTLTAKGKTATVKLANLKKKNQTVAQKNAFTVSKAQGKVTYAKASGEKKITVAKNGKITVKKGLKKGTYKVKVKVTAAGNANYKSSIKTVTVTIKVK